MILPALVIDVLGVRVTVERIAHVIVLSCNPDLSLIARYVNVDQFGVCTNHQVFYSAVRSMSTGLQSWNRRGLLDLTAQWEHRWGVSC